MKSLVLICPSDSLDCINGNDIEEMKLFMKSLKFDVSICDHCNKEVGHNAGTIFKRVEEIEAEMKSNTDVVMAFWGGKNTNQILDSLNYQIFKESSSMLIGYSDVTALLLAVYAKTGNIVYYGPGGINFIKRNRSLYTTDSFLDVVFHRKKQRYMFQSNNSGVGAEGLLLEEKHLLSYRSGESHGITIAGHMNTLLTLFGTEYFPDLSGSILFLEFSEEESVEDIDRLLYQAKYQGIFENIKGLVFSVIPDECGFSKDDSFEALLDKVFSSHISDFPIILNAPFGHVSSFFTIAIGSECYINSDKSIIRFTVN